MYVEKTVTIHDDDDIVIKVEPYSSKELKITASQSNYAIYISPNKLKEVLSYPTEIKQKTEAVVDIKKEQVPEAVKELVKNDIKIY